MKEEDWESSLLQHHIKRVQMISASTKSTTSTVLSADHPPAVPNPVLIIADDAEAGNDTELLGTRNKSDASLLQRADYTASSMSFLVSQIHI